MDRKPDNETFFHTPSTGGLDGGSNSRRALKKRLGGKFPTPSSNEDAAGTPNGKMQRMLGNCEEVRGLDPKSWAKSALNPDWVEFLMGWPVSWTNLTASKVTQYPLNTEPEDLPRVCEGSPTRIPRLKCIGNGQVPQCAATAYQLLLERFNEQP